MDRTFAPERTRQGAIHRSTEFQCMPNAAGPGDCSHHFAATAIRGSAPGDRTRHPSLLPAAKHRSNRVFANVCGPAYRGYDSRASCEFFAGGLATESLRLSRADLIEKS